MPFTDGAYEEMKAAGYIREKVRGHDVYGIRQLQDLDHLLGRRWYLRAEGCWLYKRKDPRP